MKTIEIEIAMMQKFGVRQNLIVPNVSWGMYLRTRHGYQPLHECDLIVLSKACFATEIEIKISKADILADKKKRHRHEHDHIARLFFAVPDSLTEYALQKIPERAGLYSVKNNLRVDMIRQCKRNKNAQKWTREERFKLAHLGTMRILALKQKILLNSKYSLTV